MDKKKKLHIPVFDHLDKLSFQELQNYYDCWKGQILHYIEEKNYNKDCLTNAQTKFGAIVDELSRRQRAPKPLDFKDIQTLSLAELELCKKAWDREYDIVTEKLRGIHINQNMIDTEIARK